MSYALNPLHFYMGYVRFYGEKVLLFFKNQNTGLEPASIPQKKKEGC